MLKKFSIIIIMILLLVGLSGNVLAKDKYTATSTINGVTANWEYELNDSNEIEELTCTNIADLSGSITIPSTLDGKNVISLGFKAFNGSTTITEVTLPSTLKKVGGYAFSNCSALSKINFGTGVNYLGINAFEKCTALTSLSIPKNLIKDCGNHPFEGCSNITSVIFEEGITQIPPFICESLTGLTKINIPDSVTEIGGYAFEGCSSLAQDIVFPVNTTSIGVEAFSNCPKLKKVTFLGEVENMGWGENNNAAGDSVFKNHNEDLTFYCYEGSIPAKYAINYKIKYVYLTRPTTDTPSDESKPDTTKPDTTKTDTTPSTKATEKDDTTIAKGVLPQTGATMTGIFVVLAISVASIIFFIKYRKFRDI